MQTSGFGVPVLVTANGKVEALNLVSLSRRGDNDYDESWLQQLLFHHPEALPIAEIDASFSKLIPLCMEMDAKPAGYIDAVYVTPAGKLVLLETKLWRNQESRREVIVQIIDYARVLAGWDYSKLDAAVRQARKNMTSRPGDTISGGISEIVAERNRELEEAKFHDAVTKSLKKGDFLLLIAGDGISEGADAITVYLDKNASLHFTFGLVECAIYDAPNVGRFVHPRLLTKTTNIRRTVLVQNDSQVVEVETEDEVIVGDNALESERFASHAKHQAFWSEFLAMLHVEASQPISKPAKSTNQYFAMPMGSECRISAYLGQSTGQAGVYLRCTRNATSDRIYDSLFQNKDEIDKALGVKVEWHTREKDGQNWVIIQRQFPGALMDDSRKAVQKWLVDITERFIAVFRPRIDQLVREQN